MKHIIFLFFTIFLFLGNSGVFADAINSTDFVITIKTDNVISGGSNSTSFTIPTNGIGYNYSVDWDNDGTPDQSGITGDVTHDFGTAGTYTIRISGDFPTIYFSNGKEKLKILSVNQWGNISWKDMSRSFWGCDNLDVIAQDVPNTSEVTSFVYTFLSADSLSGTTANWQWDTSKVKTMQSMFYRTNFNGDISSWDTSSVTNMINTFKDNSEFNQDISNWNVSNVKRMDSMFAGASKFNQDIGGWNVSSVENTRSMFHSASEFNQDISSWDVSNVTNMTYMFFAASKFNHPLNTWNVSKVQLMNSMFEGASKFNQDISSWNVSGVTNMIHMFQKASEFDQDISSWNVSNVTNTAYMFYEALKFNQDIGGWNVSNVTNMNYMFYEALKFNQDISSWDVSGVTNMTRMFSGTSEFNQDISSWNVSNVTDMSYMFHGALKFNQPLNSWNVSNVTDMSYMFYGAPIFDQPLNNWNVSSVTDMTRILNRASKFNQSLADWDMSNVGNVFGMLSDSNISVDNYDSILSAWSNQTLQSGLIFGADGLKYCFSKTERQNIIDTYNWSMRGDMRACPPAEIVISAPSKLSNTNINNTTISIHQTYGTGAITIQPSDINISGTASPDNIVCTPVAGSNQTQIDCTLDITSSGFIHVDIVNSHGGYASKQEFNYIIDTIPPSVPVVEIDVSSPFSVDNPNVIFLARDNHSIDYYTLSYTGTSGVLTTMNPATSPVQISFSASERVHELTVTAYDTAGNSTSNTVRFPPIITFSTPTTLSNTGITDTIITITSPDDNDLDSIIFTANSGSVINTDFTCVGEDNGTTEPLASPVTCTGGVIGDTGSIQVKARDVITLAEGKNTQSYVIDKIAPIITLNGTNETTLEVHSSFTDSGATCNDNYDAVCNVTTTGSVDTSTVGDYTLYYMAQDQAGNNAIILTRTVHIVDTTPPVLSLQGNTPQNVEVYSTFTDNGAIWTDNYDGSGSLLASSGVVNTNVLGEYILEYNFTDANGNSATTLTRKVKVVDTTSPIITLIGNTSIQVVRGYHYSDSGATAEDNYDGDITGDIHTSENVDANTLGIYPITYTVTDTNGNTSTKTRTIEIVAGDFPFITLKGDNPVNIEVGNIYTEPGYSAQDNEDGDITSSVSVTGNIDTNTLGIYTLTYSVTDQSMNTSSITRNIQVIDIKPPIISNPNPHTLFLVVDQDLVLAPVTCKDNYDSKCNVVKTGSVDMGKTGTYTLNFTATDTSGNITSEVMNIVVSKKIGSSGDVIYDRCEGDDTSGSIYDGKCSKDDSQSSTTQMGNESDGEKNTNPEEEKSENVEEGKNNTQDNSQEEGHTRTNYTIEHNFEDCPIISWIQKPTQYHKSGVFVDEYTAYNTDTILKFAKAGIINGFSDGTVRPTQKITRAEFLKIALASHCYKYGNLAGATRYVDVERGTWQSRVIEKAESLGMIHGYEGNVFLPNKEISKAEAVKILMRLSHIQANTLEELEYNDVSVDWEEKYIRNGQSIGLFTPSSDAYLFYPNTGVERQDMIELIDDLVQFYK